MAEDTFPYPVKRPEPYGLVRNSLCTLAAAMFVPVWLPPVLVGVSLAVHNWQTMFFSFMAVPSMMLSVLIGSAAEKSENAYPARHLRWLFKIDDEIERDPRYLDATERKMLNALWAVNESAEKLREMNKKLLDQRKGVGDSRQLEGHARAALQSGDEQLASSLLTSAVAAEKQAAWIDEQIEQNRRQLNVLAARTDNLKTRLALYKQTSISKDIADETAKVRREAAEALAGLEGTTAGDALDHQARTEAIKELQEAGFFDDVEAVPAELLGDQALAECSTEVAERLAAMKKQLPAGTRN